MRILVAFAALAIAVLAPASAHDSWISRAGHRNAAGGRSASVARHGST
jgi:hypothetical protein